VSDRADAATGAALSCHAEGMDEDVAAKINELAAEEHRLEQAHSGEAWTDDDAARLREVELALDQCWDLLRQRRARRGAGLDPDDATPRDLGTVEGYQQ
jgi:hypothetical protein